MSCICEQTASACLRPALPETNTHRQTTTHSLSTLSDALNAKVWFRQSATCRSRAELSSDWQSGGSRRLLTGFQTKGSVSLLAWHAGSSHVEKKSWRWSTRANLEALPVLRDFNLIHEISMRGCQRDVRIFIRSLSLIHTNKLCITVIRALAHWEDTFYTGLHKLTANFIWQI